MRLSRIKLSGFKTFVDSTSLNFPSNLTGKFSEVESTNVLKTDNFILDNLI